MCIFPALKQFIKGKLSLFSNNKNNCDNTHIGGNVYIGTLPPQEKVSLNEVERKILILLAEGGRAVPCLDEKGIPVQINIYNHEEADSVDVCAESTLAAYKSLLRKGLITKRKRNDNQEEYIITEKGRNVVG